jgi:hypothetical protein
LQDIQKLLEDLSWDNSKDVVDTAINKLLQIDDKMVLIPLVEDAVRKAYFEEDFIWIAGLRQIVEEIGIEEFLNPRTSHLLNLEKLFLSDVQF